VRAAPAAFLETTWGCTGGKAARSTVCRGQDTPPRRRFPAQRRNQKTAAHSPANRCSQTKISFSLSQTALPVQLGPIVSVSTSRKSPLGLPNALLLIVREPTAAIHPSASDRVAHRSYPLQPAIIPAEKQRTMLSGTAHCGGSTSVSKASLEAIWPRRCETAAA